MESKYSRSYVQYVPNDMTDFSVDSRVKIQTKTVKSRVKQLNINQDVGCQIWCLCTNMVANVRFGKLGHCKG